MGVTEYLDRARDCLDLADDLDGEFRDVLLQAASMWLRMAEMEAARSQLPPASGDETNR